MRKTHATVTVAVPSRAKDVRLIPTGRPHWHRWTLAYYVGDDRRTVDLVESGLCPPVESVTVHTPRATFTMASDDWWATKVSRGGIVSVGCTLLRGDLARRIIRQSDSTVRMPRTRRRVVEVGGYAVDADGYVRRWHDRRGLLVVSRGTVLRVKRLLAEAEARAAIC